MGVVRAAQYALAGVPRAGEAVEKGYRSSLVRAGYSRFWNMLFHLRSTVVRRMVSQRMLSQGTTTGARPCTQRSSWGTRIRPAPPTPPYARLRSPPPGFPSPGSTH